MELITYCTCSVRSCVCVIWQWKFTVNERQVFFPHKCVRLHICVPGSAQGFALFIAKLTVFLHHLRKLYGSWHILCCVCLVFKFCFFCVYLGVFVRLGGEEKRENTAVIFFCAEMNYSISFRSNVPSHIIRYCRVFLACASVLRSILVAFVICVIQHWVDILHFSLFLSTSACLPFRIS